MQRYCTVCGIAVKILIILLLILGFDGKRYFVEVEERVPKGTREANAQTEKSNLQFSMPSVQRSGHVDLATTRRHHLCGLLIGEIHFCATHVTIVKWGNPSNLVFSVHSSYLPFYINPPKNYAFGGRLFA